MTILVKRLGAYCDFPLLCALNRCVSRGIPPPTPKCRGKGFAGAVYQICCYPYGGIAICRGGAPVPSDAKVHGCMIEHEVKHIWDLKNDVVPCDKSKCSYKVQLHCAISQGNKNDTECSGYCAELRCLNNAQPQTPDVKNRKGDVKYFMSIYCRGGGTLGCARP